MSMMPERSRLLTPREVIEVLNDIVNSVWAVYRDAGMPYGDTDEGFARWARERNAKQNPMKGEQHGR